MKSFIDNVPSMSDHALHDFVMWHINRKTELDDDLQEKLTYCMGELEKRLLELRVAHGHYSK